jgi:uncharacterized repeat protein (TIGR03803 family)
MSSRFSSAFVPNFRARHLVAVLSLTLLASAVFGQTVKIVANFKVAGPCGSLMYRWAQGRDGRLYGTGSECAGSGNGYFLRFDPSTQDVVVLHGFNGGNEGLDGGAPVGGVTLGSDNNFYGTTAAGGSSNGVFYNEGVLYKVTMNGTYTVLHTFTGKTDGGSPYGPPIEATDGNLYGTTSYGSATGSDTLISTIYRFTQDGVFNTIYTFNPSTTGNNAAALIQGSDGKLYVTAEEGGAQNGGAAVKIALYGGLLDTYTFGGSLATPFPNLIQASDGNYYGTVDTGSFGKGGLFELTPAFEATLLYSFGGTPGDGTNPDADLVQGTDGNLYGSTHPGSGNVQSSTLYQWSFSGGYRQLYVFPVGEIETYGLMQHTNGLFYGVMREGGTYNDGYIFSLDMGLGPFVALVRPHGKVGSNAQILGQGLTGTSSVTFNGIAATSFTVVSDTYMTAVVPSGATTGPIAVTTPTGTLTSNQNFTVP